ncbi:putative lipoprotein [Pseudomonas coronafaciens pv. garcae]|uniref:Lipoprotein n=1 Tax=Pseudomonas coronafaciens pv. garcae TaxID=251653 RepID=A0AB37QS13_9PSED|nr:putative lipoprotein [Pseudomonas coronafaciens pv. garcae]RMS07744.1 putative lipoprotein [Pseudomonas coronafaciens pv. garcae]RMS41538.1 putative lipoprotein [Pseudomonas coronafaciens pv. garcae]RMU88853.1 putative lipoprotein [Pseudomonas coronafaciens pv. coronafaciens]
MRSIQPPKHSEALIEQLAKAMMLDPKTGKPMPGSHVYSKKD